MGIQAKNPFENDDPVDGEDTVDHFFADALEGLVLGVDHVGLAVRDLDEALDGYRRALGVTVEHREMLIDEGMEVARVHLGEGHVHLITPAGPDSGVAEFLDDWGPGLHHVGYAVRDVGEAIEALVAAGAEAIDPEPQRGMAGATVAWVDASEVLGSMILLIEASG